MRVAIVNLTSGGMSGGYRKYLRELIPRMRADTSVSELMTLGPEGMRSVVDWHWPPGDARRGRPALSRALISWQPDVVFVPTARMLARTGCPVVSMVRNMEPLVCPFSAPTWGERVLNLARRLDARRAVTAADRVIAVSAFVRDFLVDNWHIDSRKVGVIPHGVEHSDPQMYAALHNLTKGPQTTLFAAGSIRPSRGIEDLLSLLLRRRRAGRDTILWFAGIPTPGAESYFSELRRLSSQYDIAQDIHWLGELSQNEMHWCFANADAFIMTSRVEACPNIVLEALASGARIVSTRSRPMPEFLGDVAIYYDAGDADALSAACECVLESQAPGGADLTLRAAARDRAGMYSWDVTAAQTVAQLMEAVRGA
jgi:glycosyltransferase involved in cell wall biosynthesis